MCGRGSSPGPAPAGGDERPRAALSVGARSIIADPKTCGATPVLEIQGNAPLGGASICEQTPPAVPPTRFSSEPAATKGRFYARPVP